MFILNGSSQVHFIDFQVMHSMRKRHTPLDRYFSIAIYNEKYFSEQQFSYNTVRVITWEQGYTLR